MIKQMDTIIRGAHIHEGLSSKTVSLLQVKYTARNVLIPQTQISI